VSLNIAGGGDGGALDGADKGNNGGCDVLHFVAVGGTVSRSGEYSYVRIKGM